ncbi:hypothetical protein IEU95_13145 [Hoyosella rhizosphaerae]|nr:hypothetical protein [Hoyosella rhizosphaerae]MBN4927784.1 hypothetical protein [Hoyosella rhizosphaerae]
MTSPFLRADPAVDFALSVTTAFFATAAASVILVGGLPVTVHAAEFAERGALLGFGEPIALVFAMFAAVWSAATLGRSTQTWSIAAGCLLLGSFLLAFFGSSGFYGPMDAGPYLALRAFTAVLSGVVVGAVLSRAWFRPSAGPAVAAAGGVLTGLLLSGTVSGAASGIYISGQLLAAAPVGTVLMWFVMSCGLISLTMSMILDSPLPRESSHSPNKRTLARITVGAGVLAAYQIVAIAVAAQVSQDWGELARFITAAFVVGILAFVLWMVALGMSRWDGPWAAGALLVMVAFTAAAAPVISQVPRIGNTAMLLPVVAALCGGLAVGVRLKHSGYHVLNGLLLLAVVPVIGLIGGGSALVIFIQLMFLATGIGLALGSALPGAGPTATALALTVPLVAHSLIALVSTPLFRGAIPSTTVRDSGPLPALWFQVIPNSGGSIFAVSLVGLCGAGILGIGYATYRFAGDEPPVGATER